jgi:hypothetical protein
LKLGHEGPDPRDTPETQFALGWVKRVYREGKKLLADMEVPEKVASWIRDGMLRFVSVELLKDVKADTREIPWVLDAVALLGADQPAVGILKSLSLTMARSTALQCRERVAFSRDNPTTGGHRPTMADEEMKARLEAAEREAADAKRKLQEMTDKTHQERLSAHRAKLLEVFEAPIKAKEILPAVREQFKRAYNFDTDAILNFTTSDAESFAKMHPNPDAPKKVHTAGGVDPNDPAEKALFSARKTLHETQVDPSRSRDQVLTEAVMAEFRRNPDLAKAWQDAPGTIRTS